MFSAISETSRGEISGDEVRDYNSEGITDHKVLERNVDHSAVAEVCFRGKVCVCWLELVGQRVLELISQFIDDRGLVPFGPFNLERVIIPLLLAVVMRIAECPLQVRFFRHLLQEAGCIT